MRERSIVLAALMVPFAIQIHAGILDWLKGSSPAKDSSADAISSFQAGIGRLEERKAQIFEKVGTIRYDVQKTNSLLSPMLGIIRVESNRGEDDPRLAVAFITEFELVYDGKWVVKKCLVKVWDSNSADSPGSALSLTNPQVQQVQACFN